MEHALSSSLNLTLSRGTALAEGYTATQAAPAASQREYEENS